MRAGRNDNWLGVVSSGRSFHFGAPNHSVALSPHHDHGRRHPLRGDGVEDKAVEISKDRFVLQTRVMLRGIAARQFQRTFVLADGIDVTDADLANGLLSIELSQPRAETVVKKIAIKPRSNGGSA